MNPEDKALSDAKGEAWEAARDRYEAAKTAGAPIADLIRARAEMTAARNAFLSFLRARRILRDKAAPR